MLTRRDGFRRAARAWRRTRRVATATATACVLAVLACGLATGEDGSEIEHRGLAAALRRLEAIVTAVERNLAEQDRVWPPSARTEAGPPANVRELERARQSLLRTRASLAQLAGEAVDLDATLVLTAIENTKSVAMIEVMLPLVERTERDPARILPVLDRVAQRSNPCPLAFVEAIARLRTPEAASCLFRLGLDRRRPEILARAAAIGDESVLTKLIDLAETEGDAMQALGLGSLARLEPALGRGRPELADWLRTRIRGARLTNTKAALITFLGLLRDPGSLAFLRSLIAGKRGDAVELAAIGALGNLGARACEALSALARDVDRDPQVRSAATHALGAAGCRDATGDLVALLDDPGLEAQARRALRRIAGHDLPHAAAWRRWWRAQGSVAAATSGLHR